MATADKGLDHWCGARVGSAWYSNRRTSQPKIGRQVDRKSAEKSAALRSCFVERFNKRKQPLADTVTGGRIDWGLQVCPSPIQLPSTFTVEDSLEAIEAELRALAMSVVPVLRTFR